MPEQRGSPSSKGHPLDEDADDAECSKCSPVFHGGPLTSPIGRIEEKVDDPLQMKEGFSMLRASAWLSHNIGSQASYRLASPMELAFKQKSPRLDLTKDQHPDAIEEECDVLEAIGSRLEDEEELAKESREKARARLKCRVVWSTHARLARRTMTLLSVQRESVMPPAQHFLAARPI
jgi:hypothetical protein